MAKSPLATTATSTAPGQAKKRRVIGPRTLWIVLKQGSDPQAVKDQIEAVTFNGREVLKSMGTGATPAVIKFDVAAEKRGGGGGDTTDEVASAAEGVAV